MATVGTAERTVTVGMAERAAVMGRRTAMATMGMAERAAAMGSGEDMVTRGAATVTAMAMEPEAAGMGTAPGQGAANLGLGPEAEEVGGMEILGDLGILEGLAAFGVLTVPIPDMRKTGICVPQATM